MNERGLREWLARQAPRDVPEPLRARVAEITSTQSTPWYRWSGLTFSGWGGNRSVARRTTLLALLALLAVLALALAAVVAGSLRPRVPVVPNILPYGGFNQLDPGTYTTGAPVPLITGARVPLQFELSDDGWSGVRNSFRAEIGRDNTNGPQIAMWWSFGAINNDLCVSGPPIHSPDAPTTYEVLRAIPELTVSSESETTFAGHRARFVDATVQPTISAECVSQAAACCSGPVSFFLATAAGRGQEAGELHMPLNGKMRLELVDITAQPLLVAIWVLDANRFDRELAEVQPTLDSFRDAP